MASEPFHFYEDAFATLTSALNTYIGDVASNIIGGFVGVTYTLLMIYMMFYGWSMLRGMVSEPITDFMTRMVRLSVIVAIAMSASRYSSYVSDFLWSSPEALAALVADGYSNGTSNVQFLDGLMTRLYDLGDAYWQLAMAPTIPNVGLLIVAILIWAAAVAATAYGAFLLALSKMALAILLGVGPLFVLCLLFEGTKRFFDSWIGQALNYVFLVMLTSATIKLVLTIISTYLNAAGEVAADATIAQALPALALCVIAALVMTQLPSMASALGGGVAVSTLGAVGWAYGKARGGVAAMRPTSLRRSVNRARSDYRIARAAAVNVGSMPAAVYRRITGGNKNRVSQG